MEVDTEWRRAGLPTPAVPGHASGSAARLFAVPPGVDAPLQMDVAADRQRGLLPLPGLSTSDDVVSQLDARTRLTPPSLEARSLARFGDRGHPGN